MQKIPLLLAATGLITLSLNAGAQHLSYGIEGGLNQSTQLCYNPQKPLDGTTQLNPATGFHFGLSATVSGLSQNKVLDFFSYKTRLAYARRGSVQPAQFGELTGNLGPNGITQLTPVTQAKIRNTVHYLCLDLILQKKLLRFGKNSSLFVEGGFGNNLLAGSNIESADQLPGSYPYDQYKDGSLNRYNLTWIAGLGINIENKFNLFVESNKAFTPAYRSANLRVRDWSWTAGIGLTLGTHTPAG